jgi:glycerol-3-phosphate dehydrogenase
MINHDVWGFQGQLVICNADGTEPVVFGDKGESLKARVVVNAAGLHSDKVAASDSTWWGNVLPRYEG